MLDVDLLTSNAADTLSSIKCDLCSKSSGGYPVIESSGKTTISESKLRACSMKFLIFKTFPFKSPTVGLICARAILNLLKIFSRIRVKKLEVNLL